MNTRLLCLLIFGSCCGWGQSPIVKGVFTDAVTGITTRYPVEMVVLDPEKAIHDGHIAAFGSMKTEAKEHTLMERCFKPLLIAVLPENFGGSELALNAPRPNGTLAIFEFQLSKECTKGFKFQEPDAIAGGVAQAPIQIPGATPLMKPLWIEWGVEKEHVSAATFGSDPSNGGIVAAAAVYFKGHITAWLIGSNYASIFDGLGESTVTLGNEKIYRLFPPLGPNGITDTNIKP